MPAADWDDHGPFAAVQSRDQRTARVLGIDPAGGTTRVLAEQRDGHLSPDGKGHASPDDLVDDLIGHLAAAAQQGPRPPASQRCH